MKKKFLLIASLLLLFAGLSSSSVFAQSATSQTWTSSITYYTPDDTGGTMSVNYYAEGSATSVDVQNRNLSPHAAGSIFIGSTNVPAGFEGGAVISSNVEVTAVNVQFAANGQSNNYGRLLYSGFNDTQAAQTFYIPTVLYQRFNSTSLIGVQNIESFEIDVTLDLYPVGSTTPAASIDQTIPAQSSWVASASEFGLAAGFDGSATISPQTGGDAGRVVATAQETGDNNRSAYAFEGTAQGSETVYMASAICNAFGGQNSFYAIQNASQSDTASVTIDFYNTSGGLQATMPATNLGPNAKMSVNPCNVSGVPAGFSGSAVIRGDTGDSLIAIGKVKAPNGIATAFVGEGSGRTESSMAYIRWAAVSTAEFRAFIAIMNVGTGTATGCTATYYDANGNGTVDNLPNFGPNIKVNTNPSTAGATDATGNFGTASSTAGVGGALEISCNEPVIAVARLTKDVNVAANFTKAGEDYSATGP